MNFCANCAARLQWGIPTGEDRKRFFCGQCGAIHYQNPRLVVGTIPEWHDQLLLCRRDIEPRRGLWTLPAGYLENGESAQQGACRETREEASCEVTGLTPYYLADLVKVHQLYLLFRCQLVRPQFAPTRESSEVRLFSEGEIPWDDLAFAVIRQTLSRYFEDRATGRFIFRNEAVVTPCSTAGHHGPPSCS
ncbi:MAG: NUDIX hydrolase [Desulfopila sp.]